MIEQKEACLKKHVVGFTKLNVVCKTDLVGAL